MDEVDVPGFGKLGWDLAWIAGEIPKIACPQQLNVMWEYASEAVRFMRRVQQQRFVPDSAEWLVMNQYNKIREEIRLNPACPFEVSRELSTIGKESVC